MVWTNFETAEYAIKYGSDNCRLYHQWKKDDFHFGHQYLLEGNSNLRSSKISMLPSTAIKCSHWENYILSFYSYFSKVDWKLFRIPICGSGFIGFTFKIFRLYMYMLATFILASHLIYCCSKWNEIRLIAFSNIIISVPLASKWVFEFLFIRHLYLKMNSNCSFHYFLINKWDNIKTVVEIARPIDTNSILQNFHFLQ